MQRIHKTPADYATKFADFIKMCAQAKTQGIPEVIVANPRVIGDDYDEVMESLSRLAENGLALKISHPVTGK